MKTNNKLLLIINFKERDFPSAGEPGYIMIKQIDIGQEFSQMQNLVSRLSGESCELLGAGHSEPYLSCQLPLK